MPNNNASYCFIGNLLCLDLVNTEMVSQGAPLDLLQSFSAFIDWLRQARQISAAEARAAEERWASTSEGKAAFAEVRSLRTQLRVMCERLSTGKTANQAALDAINRALSARASYPQVFRRDGGYVTRMQAPTTSPHQLLFPIAESAAWLLEHGAFSQLRRCENPNCVLYYYDTTKNKRRRWCSMDACGSRAKAAAYYRRLKVAKH